MTEIELKKKNVKEKLENELYVDRYNTFKESVELINTALDIFKIDYHFTYNDFCSEFTNECLNYIDEHPTVDMLDTRQMMVYAFPIIMSIINNAKNKHELKNDQSNIETDK